MALLHVLLLVVCTANVAIASESLRVFGGLDASRGNFPYQISLRDATANEHKCGGSIISQFWVLTAAHCVNYEPIQTFLIPLEVVVGTISLKGGGDHHRVTEIILHEDFIMEVWHNDIAVLRVGTPIEFNSIIQPILMANEEPLVGSELILSGWGRTTLHPHATLPDTLQFINLTTYPFEQCIEDHHESVVHYDDMCTFTTIGEGACKGDSGGPLVSVDSFFQVGIVSWGRPCATGLPDVYTRVDSHREWIFDMTGI